jgi:hypothetical protein
MAKDCRSQWDTYSKETPEEEGDFEAFLIWTRNLTKENANSTCSLHEQYERANQRESQSPIDFDIYLRTLEREMTQMSNQERANRFLAKLRDDLRAQIKLSGMSQLPDTRQGMVSLAQRIFEGMRNRRQGRTRDDQKEKTERERPNQGGFRGRGRGNHG